MRTKMEAWKAINRLRELATWDLESKYYDALEIATKCTQAIIELADAFEAESKGVGSGDIVGDVEAVLINAGFWPKK